MAKKILIIAGGGIKHLAPFKKEAEEMGLDLTLASFSDLAWETGSGLTVGGKKLVDFDVIYLRLVGKRTEEASLLVDFAKENGIKIVDRIYEKSQIIRLPLSKSLEVKMLGAAGIGVPKTLFGKMTEIVEKAPDSFGIPFVIKDTRGKQGHGVFSPRTTEELQTLSSELRKQEKEGKRFLAQEFIAASQRVRVFVIGGKAVGAITRPTRWRKRFTQNPPVKKALIPIPSEDAELAVRAAKALDIDIAGVDIIHEDATGKPYVLEVNSAPRWESISKDTGLNVEREILRFLAG